jgi:hypothetical protein
LGEEIFASLAYSEVEPPGTQESAIYTSSGLLATNLPLFPGRLQLSVALRMDVLACRNGPHLEIPAADSGTEFYSSFFSLASTSQGRGAAGKIFACQQKE